LTITNKYGKLSGSNINSLTEVNSYINDNWDEIPTILLTEDSRNINYTDGYDPNISDDFQKHPLLIKNMCFFIENIKRVFLSANSSSITINSNPNNDIFIIVHENIKEFPTTFYQSLPDSNFRNFLHSRHWYGDTNNINNPVSSDTLGCIITGYTNSVRSDLYRTNIFEVGEAR